MFMLSVYSTKGDLYEEVRSTQQGAYRYRAFIEEKNLTKKQVSQGAILSPGLRRIATVHYDGRVVLEGRR